MSIRTPQLAEDICQRLAEGHSLRTVCTTLGNLITESGVRKWAMDDEQFGAQYARARSIGLDSLAEKTIEIAGDKSRDPNCRRVEVEAIKWFTSKLRPDKYGDRLELAGKVEHVIDADVLRAKRAERMAKGDLTGAERARISEGKTEIRDDADILS